MMGQRMQAYLALPPCDLCNGTGTRPDMKVKDGCNGCGGTGHRFGPVVGIHHQWLYGHTAARMVERALKLFTTAEPSYGHPALGYDDPRECLAAVFSVDADEGYYHRTHVLKDGECADPRLGDNNDGIVVLDARALRRNKPVHIGYCFMVFTHHEGARRLPPFEPLTVRQYVDSYYPVTPEGSRLHGDDPLGEQGVALIERRINAIEAMCVGPTAPVYVLDKQALVEIFPAMFPAAKRPTRVRSANRKKPARRRA